MFERELKDVDVVVLMEFGSGLYGTNTPNSDKDYKGVFIPSAEQIVFGTCPPVIKLDTKADSRAKNTKDDIDFELWPLHKFVDKCLAGDPATMDMLHAPSGELVRTTRMWEFIRDHRASFYFKCNTQVVEYCMGQAAKYGLKGSRLACAREVQGFLYTRLHRLGEYQKMESIWDDLPTNEFAFFIDEFYEVCGKKMQRTARISYCLKILDNFFSKYGARALAAEKNEGIDWKAVSHAVRYVEQIKELYLTGDIVFPLKKREIILEIKQGLRPYKTEVEPYLEALVEELDELEAKSCLPAHPDEEYWKRFLYINYKTKIKGDE
ncbi:MAG: hypothetical protein GY799_21015 [Desulfobulbaceae bacterium]|nr:hypothetical protein [Desulfobulbaceae bacterium]